MEHVFWTRLAINSMAYNMNDTKYVSDRLLRNATDFGTLFTSIYNANIGQQFAYLLREHLLIAANLVMAAKRKDPSANAIEQKWYENADKMAQFLNQINPYWNLNEMKNMLYHHLGLTKNEAVAILTNQYQESINLFDQIEKQALGMGSQFTSGIAKQFSGRFS